MTTTYLTGTRQPGSALLSFLPDFIEMLIHRGETMLTSNKKGIDEAVIRHCQQRELPLQVCEFWGDRPHTNRRVEVDVENIEVQRIYSPSWRRFKLLTERADKMVFLHSAKTKGGCYGISTIDAFEQACRKRNIEAEQLIIQHQYKPWVSSTELRNALTVGAIHVYVYVRNVPGLAPFGTRHSIAYFRIETWRRMGEIVQPGIGFREIVIPSVTRDQSTLHALHQALLELKNVPTQRLVIHYTGKYLPNAPFVTYRKCDYLDLRAQVRELLNPYSQVVWQYEEQVDLLQRLGAHISKGQALWDHDRAFENYRGLYQ